MSGSLEVPEVGHIINEKETNEKQPNNVNRHESHFFLRGTKPQPKRCEATKFGLTKAQYFLSGPLEWSRSRLRPPRYRRHCSAVSGIWIVRTFVKPHPKAMRRIFVSDILATCFRRWSTMIWKFHFLLRPVRIHFSISVLLWWILKLVLRSSSGALTMLPIGCAILDTQSMR